MKLYKQNREQLEFALPKPTTKVKVLFCTMNTYFWILSFDMWCVSLRLKHVKKQLPPLPLLLQIGFIGLSLSTVGEQVSLLLG